MTTTTTNHFGRFLKAHRQQHGVSLRALAEQVGCSHVYLGEVERGVQKTLAEKWWPALIGALPGLTHDDLERRAIATKGVQFELIDAPPRYQDLGVALARRIDKRDLSTREFQRLMEVLDPNWEARDEP